MEFAPFRDWTHYVLITFLILLATAHAQMGASQNGGQVSCDELRQRMTMNFMQTYQKKVPDVFLSQLLPKWVESLLPSKCAQQQDAASASFNPASTNDHGGPLGTLGGTGTIYAMSTTRRKREVSEQEDVQLEMGISRDKRSTTTVTEEDGTSTSMDITNLVDDESPLVREKRFLNGMTLGGGMPTAGPRREISESAQMFNTLLMFTKLRKNMLNQEYGMARRGSLGTDRVSFQNGMYGDPYPGRRKRETVAPVEESMGGSNLVEEPNSRQKRFLFTAAEPGEGPPSMMSVMMGTAVDPNSGKRIDPGGDYAKNMMRNAFMAVTPFGAMTPPGKEAPEFVKKAAPAWFFSQMQQAFSPQPSFGRSFNRMRSNPVQRLQPGGYYGDRFPGKRKKRSTDAVSDNSMQNSPEADSTSDHHRQKRATSENANDVITVGDVSIPLDYFKPRDKYSDDIKYYDHRPQTYYPPQQPQPQQQSYQPTNYAQNYQQNQAYNRLQQQNAYLQRYIRLLAQHVAQQQAARQYAAQQSQWAPSPITYPPQTPPPYVAPYVPPQKPYVPPAKPYVPPPKPFVPPPQQPTPPPFSPPQPPPNYHRPPQGPPPPPPGFVDPFIHPPPGPPPPAVQGKRSARKKRSDNSDKGSSSGNFLWPSPFYPPSFFNPRSYIPPYSSGKTRKVGYRHPTGGVVYGDRVPGAHGGFPRLPTRQPIVSPAIPRGWAATRPQRPAPGRRVKRANKEFTDQHGTFSVNPFLFSPWYSPLTRRYTPPRYSPFSNKSAYRTGTGRLVYGDRPLGFQGGLYSTRPGRPFPQRTPLGLPGRRPAPLPPRVGGPLRPLPGQVGRRRPSPRAPVG